jgi:hypothetical protein
MKQLLQDKMKEIKPLSMEIGHWEYFLGQYDLLVELLAKLDDYENTFKK